MLSIKSGYHFSEACYKIIALLIETCLLDDNNMVSDFYETRCVIAGLGLPVEIINCCWNNCMIYWGKDSELDNYKFCGYRRYKECHREVRSKANVTMKKMFYFPITLMLQRLYASDVTARHMWWHIEHPQDDRIMLHISNSTVWKHFDQVNWEFAVEVRNIRLALFTDDL